ncbi:division/cell wall cluster transcriptional repressor MraZ [Ketobacter sp. MCCC 1A13808]|nr:division/cell wall cluster transcriptional repressor MraZ [Ketobacter sp. MCCC 1A13808]RLP53653.1 MAG: division/cell wall cluster transcriptional repressor MraZ [Ketobacter sp.]
MVMPSRFREALSEYCEGKLVVTVDFEGHCLTMHPLPDWQEIEQKLLSMPSLNSSTRRLQRLIFGYATEVEMDSNGRVSLPQLLRDKVDLDKKIMLVGVGKKFEIWSENKWSDSYQGWVDEGPVNLEELPEFAQSLVL